MRLRSGSVTTLFLMCALAVLLIPIKTTFDYYHEGFAVLHAKQVLDGSIPYRDFWTLYPPGQTWLLAGVFKIFGASLLPARLYDTLVRLLIVFCGYWISRKFSTRTLAVVTGLALTILLASAGFYVYAVFPALAFGLLSIVSLLAYIESGTRQPLIVAGILVGVAVFFRWDIGLYAGLGVASGLVMMQYIQIRRENRNLRSGLLAMVKSLLIFFGFVLLVVIPAYGLTGLSSGFDNLWVQVFVFPTTVLRDVRLLPYPSLIPAFSWSVQGTSPIVGLYLQFEFWMQFYLPLILYGVVIAHYLVLHFAKRLTFTAEQIITMSLTIFGICLFTQALNRYDFIHILPSTLAAILAGSPVIYRWIAGLGRRLLRYFVVFFVVVVLSLYFAIPIGFLAYDFNHASPFGCYSHLDTAGCVSLSSDQEQAVDYIQVNTSPDEPVFVGNQRHDLTVLNDVGFNFLSNHPTPTKYVEFYPRLTTTGPVQQAIVDDLKEKRVAWLVLVNIPLSTEPNPSSVSSGVFVLDNFIRANYSPVAQFGAYQIWKKRPG